MLPPPILLVLLLAVASSAHRNYGLEKTTGNVRWQSFNGVDVSSYHDVKHTFTAAAQPNAKSPPFTVKFSLVAGARLNFGAFSEDANCGTADISVAYSPKLDSMDYETVTDAYEFPMIKTNTEGTATFKIANDPGGANSCTATFQVSQTPYTADAAKALSKLSGLDTSDKKFAKINYADPINWGPIILVVLIFNIAAGVVISVTMRLTGMMMGGGAGSDGTNVSGWTALTTHTL